MLFAKSYYLKDFRKDKKAISEVDIVRDWLRCLESQPVKIIDIPVVVPESDKCLYCGAYMPRGLYLGKLNNLEVRLCLGCYKLLEKNRLQWKTVKTTGGGEKTMLTMNSYTYGHHKRTEQEKANFLTSLGAKIQAMLDNGTIADNGRGKNLSITGDCEEWKLFTKDVSIYTAYGFSREIGNGINVKPVRSDKKLTGFAIEKDNGGWIKESKEEEVKKHK